ncbi:MAG TPA: LLM class flavin-dependent oxidoreductase [Rhodopila sp.]|nr:LLM class flavin-dependent oxidoreductase [Rhodopila sp.]
MEFGIAIPTAADSYKVVKRAEELGFTHAWFYDTQMLCADCFVAMGAAAAQTSRIRLGTGVLIPSNRIAPVTANAFASLNALAPGRIDFGVGTGFTGRRTMGLGAMKQADMEEYIRVVMALLNGETPDFDVEGKRQKITFLNPGLGLINLRDRVGLHISAYGPRGRDLTARLKAGWLNFVGDVAGGVSAMRAMEGSWAKAGNEPAGLTAVAFALGCILEDGEAADGPRAMAQAGPRATVLLHRAADEALSGLPNTSTVPPEVADAVNGYIELARRFEPADARYLENHRGHLMAVKDIERPFVTAELIRRTTFTGTRADLLDRIAALRDGGYTQFTIQLIPGQEAAIEDWAKLKTAF